MSLKKNIFANYAAQIYVTLIGMIMVPIYVRYMGAESYGLVGFFAVVMAWFQVLDFGLTPTVARESARYCGEPQDAFKYRQLIKAFEGLFFIVATIVTFALLLAADSISNSWLQTEQLSKADVTVSVKIMAVTIGMRWMSGLYRGIVSGGESLVWLSWFNVFVATLRYAGVLPVFIYLSTSAITFFSFQCAVAIVELIGLATYSSKQIPKTHHPDLPRWDWTPLKAIVNFSLTVAFTSFVMILITQSDKLILSKMLSLSDYGYFSLALLVASGANLASGPIGAAMMPHMARLEAEGRFAELIRVYRSGTQLASICAASAMITIVFNAESLLWSWTGDRVIAAQSYEVLILYAIGNGVLGVAALPYYLQYAKGKLKLHLMGNILFLMLFVPTLFWAAYRHGAIGAGIAWLFVNIAVFFLWLPFVHRLLAPGLNVKWYFLDVLIIFVSSFVVGLGLNQVWPSSQDRFYQLFLVFVFGVIVFTSGAAASSVARHELQKLLQLLKNKLRQ